ncbi:MAG: dihydropteroate synthase [Actinophytocola sp.]|nr:dihydropteroate synthase [Actinophytocola sp.]
MRTDRPLIMAIVNRTPDSFFDKGANFDESAARRSINAAVEQGADIIDLGGVRAGSQGDPVDVEEELRRVIPTVSWARDEYPNVAVSVDTWRHEVGHAACEAGADLINDTWAAADPKLMDVAAQFGAGYVCSHTGGLAPRTDPHRVRYEDVVRDVTAAVTGLAERAVARGVPRDGILIDPTFDFGKNTWHSLELLRNLNVLVDTGWPVLVALSHKDFIAEALGVDCEDWDALDVGTSASHAVAAKLGGAVFRVHEVQKANEVLKTVVRIQQSGAVGGGPD